MEEAVIAQDSVFSITNEDDMDEHLLQWIALGKDGHTLSNISFYDFLLPLHSSSNRFVSCFFALKWRAVT